MQRRDELTTSLNGKLILLIAEKKSGLEGKVTPFSRLFGPKEFVIRDCSLDGQNWTEYYINRRKVPEEKYRGPIGKKMPDKGPFMGAIGVEETQHYDGVMTYWEEAVQIRVEDKFYYR